MNTFDGWNSQLYGGEAVLSFGPGTLAHYRTPGSKNGVRRYQQTDGTWTPLGLRERRLREGFGERRAARKAERAQRRTERRAAKAAERAARAERVAKYKEARAEAKRQRSVKNLTTEELKKGIERMELEQKYKEMRRSPMLKSAQKLVGDYFARKAQEKEQKRQEEELRKERNYEMARLKEQTQQAAIKAEADRARAAADQARAHADQERAKTDYLDIQNGTRAKSLKLERRKLKAQNKRFKSDYTVLGGIRKKINTILTGQGEAARKLAINSAEYESAYRRGKMNARTFIKQEKMLRKYRLTLPVGTEIPALPEGARSFAANPQPSSGNDGGKKKK